MDDNVMVAQAKPEDRAAMEAGEQASDIAARRVRTHRRVDQVEATADSGTRKRKVDAAEDSNKSKKSKKDLVALPNAFQMYGVCGETSRSSKNTSHELWIGAEVKRRTYDRDIQWTDYEEDKEETKVTLLGTKTKVSNESIVFDFGVVPCERTGTATSFNLDADEIAKAVKARERFEYED